jgi:hypothetical protein
MSKPLYNKSKTYLLPLIAPLIGIEQKFFEYVDNTYMFDENNEFQECFYITHDFFFKNPEFTKYEHKLVDNQFFQKLIDISTNKVLYVFKFPEEYLHEYYCLQQGKYSEFGEDAKKQILNFWTTIYGKSHTGVNFILSVKKILYKDKTLKQEIEKNLNVKLDDTIELGEIVVKENETFVLE